VRTSQPWLSSKVQYEKAQSADALVHDMTRGEGAILMQTLSV
jgi:hypothetical protein